MMNYQRTDISEEIDPAKNIKSKESIICHCWFEIVGLSFSILTVMVSII